MSNRARNPLTHKLMFAAAFVMVSAIATLAAFGPQAISLQRLLTPFVGASVAPQPAFKEVESQLHAEPPAPLALPGGTLAAARSGHTATLLADGKVLIVGGSGDNSAEIFDPATGTSVATGNTVHARSGHTATLLANGKVLIAGGGSAVSEIYDPATDSFALGAEMTAARSGHTATAVGSSVVISGGGSDTVEVFNGTSFAAAGTLTESRSNHSAVAMNDGRVFIAGGTGSDTAEIYNPADGTSVATGNPLAHARAKAHLRVLPDGKVQIIGGNDDVSMEVYDPAIDTIGAHVHLLPDTDTCTGLRSSVRDSQTRAALFFAGNADAAYDRTGHTITEVSGSQALVIGGTTGGAASNAVTSFASSPATITTDKLDYAPGETVTFSGTGFAPGETVRVVIHEDPHTHLERNFEATADGSGSISGSYLVEEHDLNIKFVVNARGLTSNLAAQTAFTDGQVKVSANLAAITGVSVAWQSYTNNSCSAGSITSGSSILTGTSFVNTASVGASESIRMTAPSVSGYTFVNWTVVGSTFSDTGTNTSTANPVCVRGSNGQPDVTANYISSAASTSLSVNSATGTYGGTVNLTATLTQTSPSTPLSGQSVTFSLNGGVTTITATTNGAGVATATVSLAGINAGTYPTGVSASFAGGGGYAASSGNNTLTVNKATPTATLAVNNSPQTYNGSPQSATVAISASSVPGSVSNISTGGAATQTNAGTYVVTADFVPTDAANYSTLTGLSAGNFTIDKAGSTVTVTCTVGAPYTYTGSAITPCTAQATGVGMSPVDVTASLVYSNNTNAGSATAQASWAGDTNHTSSVGNGGFTIGKAGSTVTIDCTVGAPFTYTGLPITPCSYTVVGNEPANLVLDTGSVPTGNYTNNTNAGSATASYTFAGDANHDGSTGNGGFTIGKATAICSVNGVTVTYDGDPHGATGSCTGVNDETMPAIGSLNLGGSFTNVPGGTASWSFTGGANYSDQSGTAAVVINRAPVTATAGSGSGDYNGSTQSPSACVVAGAYTGSLSCVNNPASVGPAVGTTVIEPVTTGPDLANFTVTPTNGSYTINALAITVTPSSGQSKVYGVTPDPVLTYQSSPALIGTDAFSGSLARDAGEDVGLYNITQGDLALSSNYSINFTTGVKFEITKAQLTVTADDQTRGYGDPNPDPLTYDITGFVSGDDEGDITGEAVCSTTAVATTPVANSPVAITCTAGTLAADNYSFTFVDGALEITPAFLAVDAVAASKTYGDGDPLPLTYTLSGFKNSEDDSVVTGTATCSRTAGETVLGGPYEISCSPVGLSAANYLFVQGNSANFTIDTRPATWTTNPNSKTYGDPDPVPLTTGSGSNFVAADNVTATYSRVAGETALGGPYHITATLAPSSVLSNYSITNTGAAFTINKRLATWTTNPNSKTYGDPDPSPVTTGSGNNFVAADNVTATYSRVAGENASPPTYHITATLSATPMSALDNYIITNDGAEFTINKRLATWTTDPNSKTYGDPDPAPLTTGAGSNFVTADNVTATYSRVAGENASPSAYHITATLSATPMSALDNYIITNAGAEFTINKRELIITAVTNSKTYDGDTDAAAIPMVSGLQFSDSVTGLTEVYDNRNAGTGKTLSVATYTVNDGNGGDNYTVTTVDDNTGVILPATLTLTAIANTRVYNGLTDAAVVPTVSGLISPDTVTDLTETYDTKHVGTGKTMSVATYTVNDGNGGLNYDVETVQNLNGVITTAPLTITALTYTKTYDGNTSSVAVPSVSGTQTGDTVTGLSQTYDTKHVGSGKTLSVATYTVNDGNGGNNYQVQTVQNLTGVINQKPITVTAVADTKVFDFNTSSDETPTVSPALVGGDTGNFIQKFDTQFVGTGKTLTPEGTANDGNLGNNYSYTYVPVTTGVITTACSVFNGFLPPIGGAFELGNGGTFANPVRAFKLNSTVPVKFTATCFGLPLTTGTHTLQAIKYSNSVDSDPAIDATPTDGATTGNQFRLTGTEWHFNMNTKGLGGNGQGTWLLKATLFDGSTYSVWVSIKK